MTEPAVDSPCRPVLRPLAEILPAAQYPGPVRASSAPQRQWQPDPRAAALAEAVLRAAVEFIAGQRPARQLSSVLATPVLSYLDGLRRAAGPLRPRLRGVRCQQPAPDALEASGVILLHTGTRAVFARFERSEASAATDHPWRCTSLHLPLTRGDVNNAMRARPQR